MSTLGLIINSSPTACLPYTHTIKIMIKSHGSIFRINHYSDVIMGAMASQITSLTIVYSTVYIGRSKKTSKLRVTGLCAGNSPGTGEFPAQMASNEKNVSIWWRHRDVHSVRPGFRLYKALLLGYCQEKTTVMPLYLYHRSRYFCETLSLLWEFIYQYTNKTSSIYWDVQAMCVCFATQMNSNADL